MIIQFHLTLYCGNCGKEGKKLKNIFRTKTTLRFERSVFLKNFEKIFFYNIFIPFEKIFSVFSCIEIPNGSAEI